MLHPKTANFTLLRSKHSSAHTVFIFFPQSKWPRFAPIQNNRQNSYFYTPIFIVQLHLKNETSFMNPI